MHVSLTMCLGSFLDEADQALKRGENSEEDLEEQFKYAEQQWEALE
jgi:hypothetical protein